VLDYLHDSWFYWTHRLLHWRPLYKHIHNIHHRYAERTTPDVLCTNSQHDPLPLCRSKAPSAFTGYSFHVVEAVIVFANEVLVCFLFPMHMALHRIYHLLTTLIHEGELATCTPTDSTKTSCHSSAQRTVMIATATLLA
jgi:Delta7-sterol 5-desaturase